MAVPTFVDRVTLHVSGGQAAATACASVHREKFKPLGGPDGGNGGHGGDVVLVVDPDVTTLLDYHHAAAPQGRQRQARAWATTAPAPTASRSCCPCRTGPSWSTPRRRACSPTWSAPAPSSSSLPAVAAGSATPPRRVQGRKAPGFALLGEPGDERDVVLELKAVADVGLVGYPSAGKSSLIAAISRARPKIADYPFTTLVPNLGVVTAGDITYTVADVPGLIEGASEGRGLGHDFLRHIERCAALLHVIDCATLEPGRDPLTDLDAIEAELEAYGGLDDRPRLVALNKIDVPDARDLAELVRPELEARGYRVFEISAASREGLRELDVRDGRDRRRRPRMPDAIEPTRIVLRPTAVERRRVHRRADVDGAWHVRGEKPQRWVEQTDFDNDEAVGYLADRLDRLGVEAALAERAPGGRRRRHRRGRQRRRLRVRAPRAGRRRDADRTAAGRGPAPRRPADRRSRAPRPDRHRRPVRPPTGSWSRSGRRSLTTAAGGIDEAAGRRARRRPRRAPRNGGREIVLVSSGAIAAGLAPLGFAARPRDLATPAGRGQRRAGAPDAALHRPLRPPRDHGRPGPAHRSTTSPGAVHYRNAYRTCASCSSSARCRSSTRTTRSRPTRSGSATTTGWPRSSPTWSDADLLVLLSDVDGSTPATRAAWRAAPPVVRSEPDLTASSIGRGSSRGTGGMATKVEAARIATGCGIPVVVTRADLAGRCSPAATVGTLFRPPAAAHHPPALAGPRHRARVASWSSTPARSAVVAPAQVAAARRDHRGGRGLRRRRPGRPRRQRGRRGRPRAGELRRGRGSAAAGPLHTGAGGGARSRVRT